MIFCGKIYCTHLTLFIVNELGKYSVVKSKIHEFRFQFEKKKKKLNQSKISKTLLSNYFVLANHYLFGRGILVANGTHVCLSEVRSLAGNSLMPTCITSNMENATHLVADAKTKTVYFYDSFKRQISYHVLQDDSQTRVMLAVTGNVSGRYKFQPYQCIQVDQREFVNILNLNINLPGLCL